MLEIERKYLLDSLPQIPRGAEVWQIEQGYFAPPGDGSRDENDGRDNTSLPKIGRLRRTVLGDGSIICTHTIKTGSGLVRHETERTISIEQFEDLWRHTEGRRLRKRRHRVNVDHSIWEIDNFEDIELVLAEIELPAPNTAVVCPDWLKPHIVREVTNDPRYTNSAIAARIGQNTS